MNRHLLTIVLLVVFATSPEASALGSCDASLHQQICAMGGSALCNEARVHSISNAESIELIRNSNMMSDEDIRKWILFLQKDDSVALLYVHESDDLWRLVIVNLVSSRSLNNCLTNSPAEYHSAITPQWSL